MLDATPDPPEIAAIRDALREVLDPELGMSVVDVGFIRDIADTEQGIEITMILTSPFCPMAHTIASQVQLAAQKVVDKPVKVTLGTELWDPSAMGPGD